MVRRSYEASEMSFKYGITTYGQSAKGSSWNESVVGENAEIVRTVKLVN
jgi:uncharacterized GH25 family protein